MVETDFIVNFIPLLALIAIWELFWKGIALWKAGKNNQLIWFILILILNTIGILPIIYIFFFQNKVQTDN